MITLKTDWTQYDIIKPEDFNSIGLAVNEKAEQAAVEAALEQRVPYAYTTITPEQIPDFNDLPLGYCRVYGIFANAPVSGQHFNGEVLTLHYQGYTVQKATKHSTILTAHYTRQRADDNWSGWKHLITEDEALLRSGGTMTGQLNIPRMKLHIQGGTGPEGGALQLAAPGADSQLSGAVEVGVNKNRLRFYENGGAKRGAYLELSECTAGAATRLATAEQPQIHTLPLQPGFQSTHTNSCRYWKTQEGIVTVDAYMTKTSGYIDNLELLAILPEGYWIESVQERPAVYRVPFTTGFVQVARGGHIYARHDGTNLNAVCFQVSFPAIG